jgi:D-threo-aldose 1-dehydrogenase
MDPTELGHLSRSALSLTKLGLGCAQLGGLYRPMPGADALALVDAAWDLGLRYFDTAPYYGFTLSERRLGAALRERPRGEYVISTKVGRLMRPDPSVKPGECGWGAPLPFRPHYDYTYDAILRSHEDSLQRLGMDRVDILYVHDIGRVTHGVQEAHYWEQLTRGGGLRALIRLREEGVIKAFGLGVNEWEVVAAAMDECALDCVLLAGRYTLLEQASLEPLMGRCARAGTAIVIGGPFNSGILAGTNKFDYEDAPREIVERVEAIAALCLQFDVPLQAAALQFPVAHPAVVSCIPGAEHPEQLRQNAAWFSQPIPGGLWDALVAAGLVAARAPLPEGTP